MRLDHKRLERRLRFFILVVGALSIVIPLTLIGVSSCIQSRHFANDRRPPDFARADHWTPPHRTFLKSSLEVKPVPGWRLSVAELGLPRGSRIATDPMPVRSHPFIGNIDERAFFLASSGEPSAPQWWLAGVSVETGAPLFPAIPLNPGDNPDCFLNGPDALLCITTEIENRTAWVIDSHSGAITYTGPTDLNIRPSDLNVQQVGIYAVAESVDEGVYGVGSRAETTWFVPGAGDMSPLYVRGLDIAQPPMAYQTVLGFNAFDRTLFSVVVIEPEMRDNFEMINILLYPGGFAAEVRPRDYSSAPQVRLYDAAGRRMSDIDFGISGMPSQPVFDMPALHDETWRYFTPHGELIAETAEPPVRLVGSRLIVDANEFSTRSWDQYDIHTGAKGKRCGNLDMDSGYIGYDGTSIAVTSDGNGTIGLDTEATDFDTCARLWTISSPPGSSRYVWRINTTLVQLSDGGTELMSLVAPS